MAREAIEIHTNPISLIEANETLLARAKMLKMLTDSNWLPYHCIIVNSTVESAPDYNEQGFYKQQKSNLKSPKQLRITAI